MCIFMTLSLLKKIAAILFFAAFYLPIHVLCLLLKRY